MQSVQSKVMLFETVILEILEHLEFLTRGSNKTGKTKPA